MIRQAAHTAVDNAVDIAESPKKWDVILCSGAITKRRKILHTDTVDINMYNLDLGAVEFSSLWNSSEKIVVVYKPGASEIKAISPVVLNISGSLT